MNEFIYVFKNLQPFYWLALSFITGFIVSPWRDDLFIILLFFIGYEAVWYYICRQWLMTEWDWISRLAYICAYLLGWLIGRQLLCEDDDPVSSFRRVKRIFGNKDGKSKKNRKNK